MLQASFAEEQSQHIDDRVFRNLRKAIYAPNTNYAHED